MRRLLRKIVQILDGTPAEYGKRQSGQSLIEMAFITPLLIMLVAGLMEVGWLANNYLILLEVTRVGARRGTVLVGDDGVLAWNNQGSLVPRTTWEYNSSDPTNAYPAFFPEDDEDVRKVFHDPNCSTAAESLGFYNQITCNMMDSLDPLVLMRGIDPNNKFNKDNPLAAHQEFYPDDIVVSAFALQAIQNPNDVVPPTGVRVHVVGRYPTNANECTVAPDDTLLDPPPERDPFDYIETNGRECLDDCTKYPLELIGYDGVIKEYQRGFSWYGQHKVQRDEWNDTEVDCLGSQWTIERVENLVNIPDFGLTADERQFLPTEGLVLVEIYYQHNLLTQFQHVR
jgi:hypothetical protein